MPPFSNMIPSFHLLYRAAIPAAFLTLLPNIASATEPTQASAPRVVRMDVAAGRDVHPISPWVYGINGLYEAEETPERKPACTVVRLGGNRTTAWNWVNNASNAGADWHYQNDSYFGNASDGPAAAARKILDYTQANGMAAVLTVPIIGHVAADHGPGGDVMESGADWLRARFHKSLPVKNGPFTLNPDPASPLVYQDEYVHWLSEKYPGAFKNGSAAPVFFSLDNEVDLWAHTHARLRGITVPHGEKVPKEIERKGKVSYEEIVRLNVEYARAIKAVIPTAKVLGPVVWSWAGVNDLSGAADANGLRFADYYLTAMAEAERTSHRRVIDCFTLNQYSAAGVKSGDHNIGVTSDDTSPEVVTARLQAPRSFWDPEYVEDSWLAGGKPLRMFPALRDIIDRCYPGTHIALTEYNFGARHHISGGLAQADFLGILGRERVALATWWSLGKGGTFALGAFDLYRNYDGKGSTFGNRSIHATTADDEATSIYAATDSTREGAMTIVLINKTREPVVAQLTIAAGRPFTRASTWQLTAASPKIQPGGELEPAGEKTVLYRMPPFSATLLSLDAARSGNRDG